MISIFLLLPLYFIVIQAERGGWWRVLYALWPVAWALDVVLNLTEMSLVFLEPPREFTLSQRLARLRHNSFWRGDLARYIARGLDAIAPSGKHV